MELVRATRIYLDAVYSPMQVAMLLNCFVNLGVPPPREWLSAAEIPLMAPSSLGGGHEGGSGGAEEEEGEDEDNRVRPEEAAALAMLSAAWSFQACWVWRAETQMRGVEVEPRLAPLCRRPLISLSPHAAGPLPRQVCGHTPRPEWVRALSSGADVAWSGYARTPAKSPSPSPPSSTSPESVMMPSGEEVYVANGEGGAYYERYVQPLPAQCLSALSRAAIMWGMPTGEAWLGRYLEVGLDSMNVVNVGSKVRLVCLVCNTVFRCQ